MAKTPKKPVFCYFFPFFHILESNFRPILPHRVFLTYSGVVLCRLWPLYAKKWQNELLLHNFLRGLRPLPPPPLGDTTPAILAGTKRTENSFGIIWPSPRQLRVKNTLRVGHRGPVGRKTTQKPPQNTKKWKKIVKKRLFSRFGHFGQNSDFSRKKSKTGIFFDITKPPLAQIYPKSGL